MTKFTPAEGRHPLLAPEVLQRYPQGLQSPWSNEGGEGTGWIYGWICTKNEQNGPQITPITMVYGTYNYSIHGVYKPTNWGAPDIPEIGWIVGRFFVHDFGCFILASRLVDATDRADLYRNSVDSTAQRMIYGVWFDESRIEDSKRVCV
jgi:hypothetical protein